VKGHVSVRPTRFYTFIHKEKVKASFTKCRALWGLKVLSKTTRENSSDEANWKWVFFFFLEYWALQGHRALRFTTAFGSDILPWKVTDL
jgi:hypothetical protein